MPNPFGIPKREQFPVDSRAKWGKQQKKEIKKVLDGFDAFGLPVSTERQVAALDCAVEAMGVDPGLADPMIQAAANAIERDEPASAITYLLNIVDLTGAYRLVAVLCT